MIFVFFECPKLPQFETTFNATVICEESATPVDKKNICDTEILDLYAQEIEKPCSYMIHLKAI